MSEPRHVVLLAGSPRRPSFTRSLARAMGSYEPRAYAALWQEVSEEFIGDGPAGPTDPMGRGLPRARERFEECRASWGEAGYATMGLCLDWRHDELIRDLNIDYWDSQAGS